MSQLKQSLDLLINSKLLKSSSFNSSNFNDLRSPLRGIIDIRNLTRIFLLLNIDLMAILLGWYLTKGIFINLFLFSEKQENLEVDTFFLSIVFLSIVLLTVFEGYQKGGKSKNPINYAKALSIACITLIPMTIQLYGINLFNHILLLVFATFFLITLSLINTFRYVFFKLLLYLRQRYFSLSTKVFLIGEPKDINKAIYLIDQSKKFEIDSWLDISKFNTKKDVINLIDQLRNKKVDEILICSWNKNNNYKNLLSILQCSGFSWKILQFDQEIIQNDLVFFNFEGIGAFRVRKPENLGTSFLFKRCFDIVGSLLILTILSCPMLIISILIKLDSPGPILFKQTRIGLKGNKFQILKFRTMIQNANSLQEQLESKNEFSGGILFKIKEDPRITKIGKYLRKYSFDELPQIVNVLQGEMSLIGPRPLPERDVAKFSSTDYFRQEVLPGITGLWQVSGRSDTNSENMFYLDFEYIQNWSLKLDLKILLKTIGVIFNTKGAY